MYPCLLRGQDSEDASKSAWLIDQITERRKALKQPTNSMSIQPWRLAIGLGYENGNRFTAMALKGLIHISFVGVFLTSAAAAQAQNCSSFSSCAEAVAAYKAGNTKLDRDKDGIPCEKLCGRNGQNMPQ